MKTIIFKDKDDNEILGAFLTDEVVIKAVIDKYKQEWSKIDGDISLMEYIQIKLRKEKINGMWVHNFKVVDI